MHIVRDYRSVPQNCRDMSVAIGNFDGVHLGHGSVIELAQERAAASGRSFGIVTFEPHPRQYFSPEAPPFRLMNAEARATRLASMGTEALFEIPFDKELANLSSVEFSRDVLVEGLGISCAVVGADFRFGKGRTGSASTLLQHGEEFGFDVAVSPIRTGPFGDYSSTSVRRALTEGNVQLAADLLGHRHRIEGRVIRGESRGKELGFPTANVMIENLHPPKLGIYAVTVDILTGSKSGSYQGAASIGINPTFGASPAHLEVYIFGLSEDIYGERISVALFAFLRPEEKFETIGALVEQMQRDCETCRELLVRLA